MRKIFAKIWPKREKVNGQRVSAELIWGEFFREQLRQLKEKGIPISLVTI